LTWTTVYLIWPISTTICIPSLKVFCEIGGREGLSETLNMSITRILTQKIVEMLLVLGVLKTSINLSLLTSKNGITNFFLIICMLSDLYMCVPLSSHPPSDSAFFPWNMFFCFLNHYLVEKHICSTCSVAVFLVWFSYHQMLCLHCSKNITT